MLMMWVLEPPGRWGGWLQVTTEGRLLTSFGVWKKSGTNTTVNSQYLMAYQALAISPISALLPLTTPSHTVPAPVEIEEHLLRVFFKRAKGLGLGATYLELRGLWDLLEVASIGSSAKDEASADARVRVATSKHSPRGIVDKRRHLDVKLLIGKSLAKETAHILALNARAREALGPTEESASVVVWEREREREREDMANMRLGVFWFLS
jgi:hypothetical protein